MGDTEIRAALDRHWTASDASDFHGEHEIYRDDAVLEYPQSGERIPGRRNIQSSRAAQPNRKRFAVRRIIGAGDLWVTEFVRTYDGRPSYPVSITEFIFIDGAVARETSVFSPTRSSRGLRAPNGSSRWREARTSAPGTPAKRPAVQPASSPRVASATVRGMGFSPCS